MLSATLVTIIASFLLKLCSPSPVYSMQPAYIIANIGTTGRNIRNLPCISRKTNEKGVCMFAIDCLKANGTHLGTCIDRFYFGSCCHVLPIHDVVGNTIDSAIIPVRAPPNRFSSTTERIVSTAASTAIQNMTTTSKIAISTEIHQKSNHTVAATSTTQLPTTTKPLKGFGVKLTTEAMPLTTTKLHNSLQTKAASSSSFIPQTTVGSTTEMSYKLTTFQTIEENAINGETLTSTKPPKPTTVKPQSTSKLTSTTIKPTTVKVKPLPVSAKPKPTSTPIKPRPTKPTIRPRPPTSTVKPTKISKSTLSSLSKPTRIPLKPTKGTLKPAKITTRKPIITTKSTVSTTTTTTTTTTQAATSEITHKPTTITIITTTPEPLPTENITVPQPTANEKYTVITELITNPYTTTTTKTTEVATPKPSLITTQTPLAIDKFSTTVPTFAPSTTTYVEITHPNDLVPVISVPEAVKGNLTANEILHADPLQPPPTTEETNNASFVTWTEETTSKSSTTFGPEDWMPITTPDRWVPLPSLSTVHPGITFTPNITSNNTKYNETTSPKPLETFSTTTTTAPFNYFNESSSIVGSSTTMPTTSKLPDISSTITNLIDVSTTQTSVNMSDFTAVCGRRMYPEARIVGGERATFGEWPWQISLRQWRTSTYLHKCGAALLNENWAITAAHCVDNVPPSDLLLRLGEHDLSTDSEPYIHQERRVQIVASHPQFDPRTFEYDLALLRFYEPVQFQPNIIPVCVPSSDDNFVGRNAYVTGWGRLYEDGPLPSVLQKVSVPVINNTVCESMYRSAGYIEHIPHIFICAGWRRGGFDSCEGDSGGPMVIERPDKRFLLAGVISWGIGCAEPNQPGVYTRISEFRDWINQILQF